ncbi:hypothetical protein [Pacificispira sp.]|uniref:hypothetical protein n=1 Tax=Pacificispira sp. TaxID=2888761 RepID=UPI003B51C66F
MANSFNSYGFILKLSVLVGQKIGAWAYGARLQRALSEERTRQLERRKAEIEREERQEAIVEQIDTRLQKALEGDLA